jgi:hypothetical protein
MNMEKYLNAAGLLLVAAGLFTLSYVIHSQADRGRWLSVLHEPGASAVVDSYTGRVWHMTYEGKKIFDVQIIDLPKIELEYVPVNSVRSGKSN